MRKISAINPTVTTPEVAQSNLDRARQHNLSKEIEPGRIEALATAELNFKSHQSIDQSRKRGSLGRNFVGNMIPTHHSVCQGQNYLKNSSIRGILTTLLP